MRGFAVVASEVRVLAQKTQESTGSIQRMISNLQTGSDRATTSMQETLGEGACSRYRWLSPPIGLYKALCCRTTA